MKGRHRTKKIILVFMLLLWGTGLSWGETTDQENGFEIENRTDVIYYDVTGPGKSASFYDDGFNILEELDLTLRNRLGGGWASKFTGTFRATDSSQFDSEKVSVERLTWKLTSSKVEIDLGDYFANFSQYSMNKGIKGLGLQYNFDQPDTYFRFAAGTFDGQWEYIYDSPDGEPLDRIGTGFRFQQSFDSFRYGLNLAYVFDRVSDQNRSTEDAYSQYLPALDWEFRESGITIAGEHAYSGTDMEPVAGSGDRSSGTAHRLSIRTRTDKSKLRVRLERVSSDFTTLGGGATPDRFKASGKWDYKFNKKWSIFALYDYYENNLNGQQTATTRNQTAEAGLKASRLFSRRSMSLSASLKKKWTKKSDGTVDTRSDRVKVSLEDKIASTLKYKLWYESNLTDDDVTDDTPSDYFYGVELSSRHRFSEDAWELSPEIELSKQESENITSGGDDVTETLRARLKARYRNGTDFGIDYRLVKTDPFDRTATESDKTEYGAFASFRPKFLNGGSILCEVRQNEYDFSVDAQDYKEFMSKLALVYRFSI